MFKDQTDLLLAFNAHNVDYLVIGGHAVGEHSQPRGTKDLDLFIRSDKRNSEAVFRALAEFGAPPSGLTPEDFHGHPESVFQIGVEPGRIDILQSIPAVAFDEAWPNRIESMVDDRTPAHFISPDDLIKNKLATGRHRDLDDVERISAAMAALKRTREQTPRSVASGLDVRPDGRANSSSATYKWPPTAL
jgi:Nucleotidyl transferase of unknown function (DUF2204)